MTKGQIVLIALLAVGGAALIGFMDGRAPRKVLADQAAAESAAAAVASPQDGSAAGAPPGEPAPASSLSLVESGGGFQAAPADAGAAPSSPGAPEAAAAGAPAGGLNDAARRHGAAVSAFTKRFRERHPVMRQYSKEWMSHPDLKKLNDDYMKDHDLARFVDGLTAAPSFGPLVRRIASDPASHQLAMDFVTGVVRETPPELMGAAAEVLNKGAVVKVVKSMAVALGVPLELLSSLSGGALDASALADAPAPARPARR